MNLLNCKNKNERTNFCMIQKWGYRASFSKAPLIFKYRSPVSDNKSSFWHAKIALVNSFVWVYGYLSILNRFYYESSSLSSNVAYTETVKRLSSKSNWCWSKGDSIKNHEIKKLT